MNKILFGVLLFSFGLICSFHWKEQGEVLTLKWPKKWPEPHYDFSQNPGGNEAFELGRVLFYDPALSRDNSISCANCHLQYTGFAHVDHNVSHGIEGRKGTRNAPALINLAWNSSFHWDGGVNNIEVQPINPIQHPAEMDNKLENVLKYLNASDKYKKLFFNAYSDSTIDSKLLLKAIAKFTTALISCDSKYDQYLLKQVKFSKQEKNGLKLFTKHCNACHTAPLFNSNKYASNGLKIDSNFNDVGRYAITQNPNDSLLFRIPTLRNIQHTFPYMHDGRFKHLKEVIAHYVSGIDRESPYLAQELKTKIELNAEEQKDLIAFLYTLTDKTFLYNTKFSFPR